MKELLREEEEKTRVSANKDTNARSSSHDPQQGSYTYIRLHCHTYLVSKIWPCKLVEAITPACNYYYGST